jgi:hypothetical protein
MDKLTDFQKRMIVLGVGFFIVLLGLVQAIFKPQILITYKKIIDEGTFILMMLAAMLLFSIKRKRKPEPENQNQITEQVNPEEVKVDQLEEKK